MKKDFSKARSQTGQNEFAPPAHVYGMVAIEGAIISIPGRLWLPDEVRVIDKNDHAVAMLLASLTALFSIGWLASEPNLSAKSSI